MNPNFFHRALFEKMDGWTPIIIIIIMYSASPNAEEMPTTIYLHMETLKKLVVKYSYLF